MIIVSKEDVNDYCEMMAQRYSDLSFVSGIRTGINWIIEQQNINDLVNTPKPHVPEIVKCGDVNKSKPEEMIGYPKMFYPECLPKECNHMGDTSKVYSLIGFTCIKCGQWINTPLV